MAGTFPLPVGSDLKPVGEGGRLTSRFWAAADDSMSTPSKTRQQFKKAFSAIFYGGIVAFCYVWLILNGIWGLRNGRISYPIGKGETPHVARAAHPVWFWIVEAIDWLLVVLIPAVAWAVARDMTWRRSKRKAEQNKTPPAHADHSLAPVKGASVAPAAPATPPLPPASKPEAKAKFPFPQSELRSTSPGGRYQIRAYPREMRMSHWVETPEVIDTATNQCLFHPLDDNWSLVSAVWQSECVVTLRMRRYPGTVELSSFEVQFDCAKYSAKVGGAEVENLGKVEYHLKKAYDAARKQ